jgi:hypothetical protein
MNNDENTPPERVKLGSLLRQIGREAGLTDEDCKVFDDVRDKTPATLDSALEHWLRTEVAAAYDEMKADPSRGLTVEQVLQHLAEKRASRSR